jgi:hypothetical protein
MLTNLTKITEYLDINSYVHKIGGEVVVSTTQCNNATNSQKTKRTLGINFLP